MNTPLPDVLEAIRDQLEQQLVGTFDTIQVVAEQNYTPTPPTIDIYPDFGVFMVSDAFGTPNRACRLVVRARVVPTDQNNGQTVLLQMMDRIGGGSVLQALASDSTFGGSVEDSTVEEQTGYGPYVDPASQELGLVGSEWHLRVTL